MNDEIDYFDIIIRGHFDFKIPYLDKYLYRKFKDFEKYNYDSEEFFTGCLRVINSLENNDFDYNDRIASYSRELNPNLLRYPIIRGLSESDIDKIRGAIGQAKEKVKEESVIMVKDNIKFIELLNEEEEKGNEKAQVNDVLKSTIEDHLEEFKDLIKPEEYELLVGSLSVYFEKGSFPNLEKIIKIKKTNKKKIGWALNNLYRSEKNGALSFDYLLFAKQHISLFSDDKIDESTYRTSNLYKYFTTKHP